MRSKPVEENVRLISVDFIVDFFIYFFMQLFNYLISVLCRTPEYGERFLGQWAVLAFIMEIL